MPLRLTSLQIGNIAAFLFAITLNGVSNLPSKPFGGQTNADISNAYKTAFTPAGYAFSIWGLIYSLGSAFVIYQAFPSQLPMVNYLGYWFIINMIANGLWLICFSNELLKMWLSVIVMFVFILFPLLVLYRKLNPQFHPLSPVRFILGRSSWFNTIPVNDPTAGTDPSSSTGWKGTLSTMFSITPPRDVTLPVSTSSSSSSSLPVGWGFVCYNIFISVYLGWICVASIANTAIALTPRNNTDSNLTLGSLNLSQWSIVMQIIASILGLLMLLLHLDAAVVGPIAWALIAIHKQQQSPAYPGNGDVVSISSILGWGLVILASITVVLRTVAWYKFPHLYGTSTDRLSSNGTSKHSDEEENKDSMMTPLHS